MIWKTFSICLPRGAKRLIFTMNYHLRDDQVFRTLTPNWLDPIWIKLDPLSLKWGPNWAQPIFTNFRSTAQADVMFNTAILRTDPTPGPLVEWTPDSY